MTRIPALVVLSWIVASATQTYALLVLLVVLGLPTIVYLLTKDRG